MKAVVTGAGGFIGHHLMKYLKEKGYWVRGVDIKHPEFSDPVCDEFLLLDLRERNNCLKATEGVDEVYALAANMGGIGYITDVHAAIMRDNVLINTNTAEGAYVNKVEKIFYASSACVYPISKQETPDISGLREDDAYPADPDNEYGWEKLFSERMYQSYHNDFGLAVRIGRFHNIYGPEGTYDGGREKSPAALCRKVATAEDNGSISIWGDGKQSRSYCYIDDCLEGVYQLMQSNYSEPLNIGSDELVTINQLADMIIAISGKNISKEYELDKPQGVRGRNADNTLIRATLGWAPSISAEEGMSTTYVWINSCIKAEG